MDQQKTAELICEIGRRMYERNMVAANDGNLSVKIGEDEILCTPTGISKGYMTPECICLINKKGEILHANEGYKPSSEIKMHLRVYQERPDVKAVVHAHPVYATTFAIAEQPLEAPILTEAVVSLGRVPVARYARPSTDEVPDSVAEYVQEVDAMLLAHHGALTYGDDLLEAYMRMESVEFYARQLYQTACIGVRKELTPAQVEELYEIHRVLGIKGRHPAKNEAAEVTGL